MIVRCDNSGLGTQSFEAWRHLKPAKTLVIDVGHMHNLTTHCNKRSSLDRYPGATVVNDWTPTTQLLVDWMRDLDTVLTFETPYNFDLYTIGRQQRVKTVTQFNYEFLPHIHQPWLPKPDVLAAPSKWHWGDITLKKTFLPVPIATDRFAAPAYFPDAGSATHFLHVVGRPAIHDRNGTPDLIQALQHVKSSIKVTLKCQDVGYLNTLLGGIPKNVELVIDSGDTENYWDNYTSGDVLIMPRRFGGLCLPVNEALGAGMPVIMPDISPNEWLPEEWLIPARKTAEFVAMNHVDVYQADPILLAEKIDQFASDDVFYQESRQKAEALAKQYSWNQLLPEYEKVLA